MGRVRSQAADSARAREPARAALTARAGGEPRSSLEGLCSLTPSAPGTDLYLVTFAAWEASEDRFIRLDVHEREVWATDATSARRVACERVRAMPGHLAAWRVRMVARARTRLPAAAVGSDRATGQGLRAGDGRAPRRREGRP
jgi:hypothetical protein